MYSLDDGLLNLQLSPRPKSVMYCFSSSVECQDRRLPAVLDRSVVGLITVLKSPPIMISVDSCNVEKNVLKKDGL